MAKRATLPGRWEAVRGLDGKTVTVFLPSGTLLVDDDTYETLEQLGGDDALFVNRACSCNGRKAGALDFAPGHAAHCPVAKR